MGYNPPKLPPQLPGESPQEYLDRLQAECDRLDKIIAENNERIRKFWIGVGKFCWAFILTYFFWRFWLWILGVNNG